MVYRGRSLSYNSNTTTTTTNSSAIVVMSLTSFSSSSRRVIVVCIARVACWIVWVAAGHDDELVVRLHVVLDGLLQG